MKIPGNGMPQPIVVRSSPRWDHWRNMLSVELWEAVALSLDVEPSLVMDLKQDEFKKRLLSVLRNFQPSEDLNHIYKAKKPHCVRVYLSDVLRFGHGFIFKWDFPKEFYEAAIFSRKRRDRCRLP